MTPKFTYIFCDGYTGSDIRTDPKDQIHSINESFHERQKHPENPKKYVKITGIYSRDDELTIPAILDGYQVSVIGKRAFCGTGIKSIDIEDGICSIEDEAFKNCRELIHIRLPGTLSSIGNHVFENCVQLKEITLPAAIAKMGNGTFIRCQSLKQITIQTGIRTLGKSTFLECTSLTEIEIPDSIHTIGFSLFWHCTKLKSVKLGNQTKAIERDAFLGCENLTAISVPSCICSVSRNAFKDTPLEHTDIHGFHMIDHKILLSYTGVQQQLHIPDGTAVIAEDAFCGNKNLRSVICADTLLGIGKKAFQNCDHLSRIQLNSALIRIESSAFEGCKQLKDIHFPDSLTILEDKAFCGCLMLDRIVIPPKISRICDYTFKNCESALQIYFSGNITHIGVSAFEYCKSVTHIRLPKTTSHIGKYAFYGCSALSECSFPKAIERIEEDAFGHCRALTNISTYKWILGPGFLGLGNSTDITFLKEDDSKWVTLFYADDWRRFVDAPGRDKLVHALLHAPEQIDFDTYDTCLSLLIHVEDQIDLALNRLLTPVQLTEKARKYYEQFLCKHPPEVISFVLKKNLPEAISLLYQIDFFTKDTLTKAIDTAGQTGNTQILLLLMDYRSNRFSDTALEDLFRLD